MGARPALSNEQWARAARAIAAATSRGPKGRDDSSSRKVYRGIDGALYRSRNVIERWFGRLKAFRRVATRYEKTLLSYVGVVATAAFVVALSGWRA